jgi:hypothetical protein
VHEAAALLDPERAVSVEVRRQQYRALYARMSRERERVGELAPAVGHFLKVTKSYWRGLFHCYELPTLPRTNNELEQMFGSARYHERRATGRKGASPGLVVRGAVRIVALVSQGSECDPAQLRPRNIEAWKQLRRQLGQRETARRAQRRFRRDPQTYLQHAESLLLGATLPA